MLIIGCSIFLVILLVLPSEQAVASKNSGKPAIEVGKTYDLSIPEQTKKKLQQVAEQKPATQSWQTATVKSGDTLAKIMKRFGHGATTTHKLTKTEHGKELKSLRVGEQIQLASNDDGELVGLQYKMSMTETLHIAVEQQNFTSRIAEKQVEVRTGYAQATITSNFWNAGLKAGMSNKQIMNLANIFGWDVDFALDIREGDAFAVMFEDKYIDGEFVGHGNILAAEFINQGETFKAVRFKDGEYYNQKGDSMRKSFLRAPVSFQYISSNFKPKRYHPILKRYKAHNGTDYRAPKGTPVKAAGNGRVISSTYNKYNGHYVFIQHANNIVTKYLHFSKRKVKKGQRVKQGQVIGLVGSTGLSQAPHLHYEFLLNGVHRNPRTVKLPDAQPIAKKHKQEFTKLASRVLEQLEGSKQTLIAATLDESEALAE
ncbi:MULTISPECIES: peptidoglycan DD-metalloendopeptidase family protein [unclassified Thalassotalea]|uniref:peptidoglycan DD-metalloendopeptidase family protein n=1 Tax=unclassified Thalassotalea TaxID=2614972 RepID=UPI001080547D|nr:MULTISPECIES: peptidoglycan DD-metalloendopeptidase family protein [unclassified Thalassotalea]NMP15906.1 peptidoglycan DD-metalloendopeptidase family protein [Thalassotalea sp. Y01]QBY04935.1 LysM peptidoglycan-binding domain-containing protein [Thalassotalea sp. HSM 43]